MLRTLLVAVALLPATAHAAAYPWEKIESQSMAHGSVIVNYQITPNGARIFGEVPNASKEVELSDNGTVLTRVPTLTNYTFELKLPAPLDPAVDHRITVRGFDLAGKPVKLEGPRVTGADRVETAIVLTSAQLQEQRTSLERQQNPTVTGDPAKVGAAPTGIASADPLGQGSVPAPRPVWLYVTLFLVILAAALSAYAVWKRRKR